MDFVVWSFCISAQNSLSQCTPRCDHLNRSHEKSHKLSFREVTYNTRRISRGAKILIRNHIYLLTVDPWTLDIWNVENIPCWDCVFTSLGSGMNITQEISGKCYCNIQGWKLYERTNIRCIFVKFCLRISEHIKCQRSYAKWRNAVNDF